MRLQVFQKIINFLFSCHFTVFQQGQSKIKSAYEDKRLRIINSTFLSSEKTLLFSQMGDLVWTTSFKKYNFFKNSFNSRFYSCIDIEREKFTIPIAIHRYNSRQTLHNGHLTKPEIRRIAITRQNRPPNFGKHRFSHGTRSSTRVRISSNPNFKWERREHEPHKTYIIILCSDRAYPRI